MDVVACIRDLGPLVFHAAAKDAAITPGVDIRGVLDTSFERVPADAPDKVPTGYGYWCNAWPANPAWRLFGAGGGPGPGRRPGVLPAVAAGDSGPAGHHLTAVAARDPPTTSTT